MVVSAQRNHRPGLPNHIARPARVDRRARLVRLAHRRSPRPDLEPLRPERRGSRLCLAIAFSAWLIAQGGVWLLDERT